MERARTGAYDLILLDAQLPDGDSFDVTNRIRARATDSPPVIIAITADASPEERQRCLDAGMDDCVAKPFKISALKDVIVKYARQAKPHPVAVDA
jgi:CheY-like chemotaxis protein